MFIIRVVYAAAAKRRSLPSAEAEIKSDLASTVKEAKDARDVLTQLQVGAPCCCPPLAAPHLHRAGLVP